MFARALVTTFALALAACGVQQGGVCQYRPNVTMNGMDCAGGLICCVDRPILGERGSCQPEAMCAAMRSDSGTPVLPDAGPPLDAAMDDAGSDAGSDAGVDASQPEDAGTDASIAPDDAGTDDAGP